MLQLALAMSLLIFGFSGHALPDPGGLNKDGCHNNRKTGEYHCHRGQSASKLMTQSRSSPRHRKSAIPVPADTIAMDGDTIKLDRKRPNVRLVGCDTPERSKGKCKAERLLGKQSKSFLQKLINRGNLKLEYVRCSCPPGTEGTKKCNQGRACGILRVSGRNVCDVMVSEGLAVAFRCRATSCPKQINWCK